MITVLDMNDFYVDFTRLRAEDGITVGRHYQYAIFIVVIDQQEHELNY